MRWLFVGLLLASCATGASCVRSVTVCGTYDRALQRPDPSTYVQRDSAGASVCVETGPR
jgi:hypothetical protein